MEKKATITSKTKAILTVCAGVVACAYLLGMIWFQHNLERKRIPDREMITFSNLSKDTTLTALLEMRTQAYDLPVENHKIILPEALREHFNVPYRLSTTLKDKEGQARDIVVSLDDRGVLYTILLDGFSPEDKVTLSVQDSQAFAHMPMDWSGRTVLKVLANISLDFKICVDVEAGSSFGFCQTLPAKGGVV